MLVTPIGKARGFPPRRSRTIRMRAVAPTENLQTDSVYFFGCADGGRILFSLKYMAAAA